jgi:hypothetical protein
MKILGVIVLILCVGEANFAAANALLAALEVIGCGPNERTVIALTDRDLTANQFADTTFVVSVVASFALHDLKPFADNVLIAVKRIYCYWTVHLILGFQQN